MAGARTDTDGEVTVNHEVAYLSASALRRRFQFGDLDPVQVVQLLVERSTTHWPGLNATAAADVERALREAEISRQRYRSGTARELEGVPVVIKDLIDTAGITTNYGSAMFAGHLPAVDAAVVARIRACGGIVIAKTATHEFAWGITTNGTALGPTRNPWDPNLVPGGSSGGSAAALATGFAPVALGTDTAGSIRIPASFCGVAGLKPTFGAVSTAGVFSLAPSLDHVGPMARSVDDLRLLFSALTGDVAMPSSRPRAADLTIGVLPYDAGEIDEDIACVIDTTVHALTNAGARVIRIPGVAAPSPYSTLGITVSFEGVRNHRRAGLWPERANEYLPGVRRRLERAALVSPDDYANAQRDRAELTAQVARIVRRVDVVLSPVTAVLPAPIGHDDDPESAEAIGFRSGTMVFTSLQSLTGVPACTVRAGFSRHGMPIGVQLTAGWGDEDVLFDVADLVSDVTSSAQDAWPAAWLPDLVKQAEQA
jgi:aspartyl-tRNA(Asn)/glutamyl-tRNA(Gln) amidotransferase subunit A